MIAYVRASKHAGNRHASLPWWMLCICAYLMLAGCTTPAPQTKTEILRVPSPSFDERRPNFVILHQTSDDTVEQALATLTDPLRKVSAHYLIGRAGEVYALVDESKRAWHAGESYWGGLTDLNSASIGIELDNNGEEIFPQPQISSLLALLDDLRKRYQIPQANFIAHGDVAPRRKVDPSRYFPWKTLADDGFGLWCDAREVVPAASVEPVLALQAFGYQVSDPTAAIQAFRRHFQALESSSLLSAPDLDLLQCLVRKKAGFAPLQ